MLTAWSLAIGRLPTRGIYRPTIILVRCTNNRIGRYEVGLLRPDAGIEIWHAPPWLAPWPAPLGWSEGCYLGWTGVYADTDGGKVLFNYCIGHDEAGSSRLITA